MGGRQACAVGCAEAVRHGSSVKPEDDEVESDAPVLTADRTCLALETVLPMPFEEMRMGAFGDA